jgi:hypothetical protein
MGGWEWHSQVRQLLLSTQVDPKIPAPASTPALWPPRAMSSNSHVLGGLTSIWY